MKSVRLLIIFFFLWLIFPSVAEAYSSVTVPVDDPVYRRLDKLEAFGLIRTMIHGQRPYVRSEIGRLIAEALENYPEWEKQSENTERFFSAKSFLDPMLEDLKRIYRNELIQHGALPGEPGRFDGALLEYIQSDIIYLNQPTRVIQPHNGLGGVDSILQPLVPYREGRHYQKGVNWSFETEHWARLGKYVALQFQPRFQIQMVESPLQSENKVFIQRLNGHLTFGKLDLEIGRDSVDWGPSHQGGLGFTSNPRPLDFIKVSSISPFLFPFFFKHLGPFEMSLILANLGPEQHFPNAWLAAYKISSKRNRYFEFGMSQLFLTGGDGAPQAGFGDSVLDFFDYSANELNNSKTIEFDLHGWVPPWRGTEIYAQILFSDLSSNMGTLFLDNASYLAGVYLPRLSFTGNLDLRLEYRRLSPRYGRSMVFSGGFTENNRLLGEPWGPDSQVVNADFHYQLNQKNLLGLGFQFFRRYQNFYQIQNSNVNQVSSLGKEDHLIYLVRWDHLFNQNVVGHLGLGLDQVLSNGFVSGARRLDSRIEAGIRAYWDRKAQL